MLKKNERLYSCPVCGAEADIYDFVNDDGSIHGIGDVGCKKELENKIETEKNICGAKKFHYSGKFGITKKEAIGMWNEYVTIINIKKGEDYE